MIGIQPQIAGSFNLGDGLNCSCF